MSEYSDKERRSSMLSEKDKEFFYQVVRGNEKKIWGFRIPEFYTALMLLSFAVAGAINFLELQKQTSYLTKFAQNSDGYHSMVLGVQFEQGRPLQSFDATPIRNLIKNGEVKK